jgi:MraZ protein
VFKGAFRHRVDLKGRLPVPAVFRRALERIGEGALVATLLDQCLAVYPASEWDKLEAQLRALPAFSKPVKALTRLLASRAADCTLDVQGRILLPPALREAAGLQREALVVGVLNRFEIWAPEAWEEFVRESERFLDDVTLEIHWPPPPAPSPPKAPEPPTPRPRPQPKPRR